MLSDDSRSTWFTVLARISTELEQSWYGACCDSHAVAVLQQSKNMQLLEAEHFHSRSTTK